MRIENVLSVSKVGLQRTLIILKALNFDDVLTLLFGPAMTLMSS